MPQENRLVIEIEFIAFDMEFAKPGVTFHSVNDTAVLKEFESTPGSWIFNIQNLGEAAC